jgi:hypothetical protein
MKKVIATLGKALLGISAIVLVFPAMELSMAQSPMPWESAAGRACFEQWIAEVERRMNAYDGGRDYNLRKPWKINQYGLLEGNPRYGPTSVAPPDDFWKRDNNRYWYIWDHWYSPTQTWGPQKPFLRGASIPHVRPYVLRCLGEEGPEKVPPPGNVVGEWNWFTGGTVTIRSNGTVSHSQPGPVSSGTWRYNPRSGRVVISWENGRYVDTLTLSQDGNTLTGANQNGAPVSGWRIVSKGPEKVPPPPPSGPYSIEREIGSIYRTDWPNSPTDYANAHQVGENMEFNVGMGSNPKWGYGYASVELSGFKEVNVQVYAPLSFKHYDINSFAGFVVDYSTPSGYAKRVMLGIGIMDAKRNHHNFIRTVGRIQNIEYVNLGSHKTYRLDLGEWAPLNWNGKVLFSVGIQNAGENSNIKAILQLSAVKSTSEQELFIPTSNHSASHGPVLSLAKEGTRK